MHPSSVLCRIGALNMRRIYLECVQGNRELGYHIKPVILSNLHLSIRSNDCGTPRFVMR